MWRICEEIFAEFEAVVEGGRGGGSGRVGFGAHEVVEDFDEVSGGCLRRARRRGGGRDGGFGRPMRRGGRGRWRRDASARSMRRDAPPPSRSPRHRSSSLPTSILLSRVDF